MDILGRAEGEHRSYSLEYSGAIVYRKDLQSRPHPEEAHIEVRTFLMITRASDCDVRWRLVPSLD
jgi:hypothetical protein